MLDTPLGSRKALYKCNAKYVKNNTYALQKS